MDSGISFDHKAGTARLADEVSEKVSIRQLSVAGFCQPWDTADSRFGNVAVLVFFLVQFLDGALTYLGIATWGVGVEANPIISSAIQYAGPETGLAAAKGVAIACGMVLHLSRVHHVVALLTVFYVGVAIVPWAALFLAH
jgi:hypothetical protein